MMSASITAYSTAVGPSSRWRKLPMAKVIFVIISARSLREGWHFSEPCQVSPAACQTLGRTYWVVKKFRFNDQRFPAQSFSFPFSFRLEAARAAVRLEPRPEFVA